MLIKDRKIRRDGLKIQIKKLTPVRMHLIQSCLKLQELEKNRRNQLKTKSEEDIKKRGKLLFFYV